MSCEQTNQIEHLLAHNCCPSFASPLPSLDGESARQALNLGNVPQILPRTLDGVSLGTVAGVVLVLVVLDVVGTLVLAGAVSGRSRSGAFFSGDWDLGGAASRVYNR